MSETICLSCRRPKATLQCDLCQEDLCGKCDRFLDAATFTFLPELPAELSHTHYCPGCHDAHIAPALESYEATMEKAKEVYFFFVTQRAPVPVLKKSKETVKVEKCADRDETILRMAFLATQQGYNGIIEADVVSTKVRNGAYQTTVWKGVGTPAQVDAEKLERRSRMH